MSKKIIILNHGLHISGVSRALVNLANALAQRGHDVTVKLEINDFTLEHLLDPRVKRSLFLPEWRLFGRRVPGFLRFYDRFLKRFYQLSPKRLYKRIVGKGYDVEMAFNRGAAARIIGASTGKTAKKLVWVHNDYLLCDNALAGFASLEEARQAYSTYDHVICVSKQAERSFRELFGEGPKLVTRSNVLDTAHIRRSALQDPPEKKGPTLCAVGRICEQKNYPLLLQAAKLLKSRGVELDLWIVGGGVALEGMKQEAAELGLENVTFWGPQENPYRFLAAAEGYVCSSIYEGLSTTTIEALVLGKACVVTDCTGMRDILGDSEYGLIVPIEAEALADGMERLLTDTALRQHYEKMAALRAEAYAPEACVREIEELF